MSAQPFYDACLCISGSASTVTENILGSLLTWHRSKFKASSILDQLLKRCLLKIPSEWIFLFDHKRVTYVQCFCRRLFQPLAECDSRALFFKRQFGFRWMRTTTIQWYALSEKKTCTADVLLLNYISRHMWLYPKVKLVGCVIPNLSSI